MDLFETLSFYVRRGVIDRETIWNEFGYWIPGYWTAAKTYVMRYREKDRDPEYYGNFEWLSEELTKESARRSRRSESEVQYTTDQLTDFLRSEADLVPDVPVATSRVLKSGVRTK